MLCKYKLIIFDFDGTLADTFLWFMSIANQVADKYKFKRIKKSEVETIRGYSASKVMKHLEVPLWKMPMIANHIRALMAKDIDKIVLFEGVDSLLQQLSGRGARLAVVSTNAYGNISRALGIKNVALINYHECGVSIFGKSAKLRKIIRESGVKYSESIFIGDEVRDIVAAKNVNIASGAVSWGYNKIELLKEQHPDELFVGIDEIVEKIA